MKRDEVYLKHILDAIGKIREYVSVGRDSFMSNSYWQNAVVRQLKRVSKDVRIDYPAVPWRRIAGLRDVLIHNYMGVDIEAVWQITQQNIPELQENIQTILKNFEVNENN